MNKLMKANFMRLWKETVFWQTILCIIIVSMLFSWKEYQSYHNENLICFEEVLFNVLPMMVFLCSGFISLFVGTEIDENTLRNKLIAGYTRAEIFLSSFGICLFASLLQLLVILFCSGFMGYLLFGSMTIDISRILCLVICCVLDVMVVCAICVVIGMNTQSRAQGVIISLMLMFGLLFGATYTNEQIMESGMISCDNQVDSTLLIYKFVCDLLPTGQMIQINNMMYERGYRWPILSSVLLLTILSLGYKQFKKKDIK